MGHTPTNVILDNILVEQKPITVQDAYKFIGNLIHFRKDANAILESEMTYFDNGMFITKVTAKHLHTQRKLFGLDFKNIQKHQGLWTTYEACGLKVEKTIPMVYCIVERYLRNPIVHFEALPDYVHSFLVGDYAIQYLWDSRKILSVSKISEMGPYEPIHNDMLGTLLVAKSMEQLEQVQQLCTEVPEANIPKESFEPQIQKFLEEQREQINDFNEFRKSIQETVERYQSNPNF